MLQVNLNKKSLYASYIQKLTFFEYLCVLSLIFFAGNANTFVRSASIKGNLFAFFIPIMLSIILAIKWKVVFDNRFFLLILGSGIYVLAITIKYHQIHITILIGYIALFFIVFTAIKALKTNLLKIYEYLLCKLAIIGLVMWTIQILLGGDSLLNLFNKIPGINTFSFVTGGGLSTILYSIQPTSFYALDSLGSGIPRNCGYAWEPGAFSIYLCLAIFINLFIIKPDNKSKVRFWILLSALVTTQSTTGFSIFILIMLYFYANKKMKIVLLALPIIITAMIYIFSLPFMGDKIEETIDETSNMDMIIESSIDKEETENPQRFVSFMIGFQNFLNNPILGIEGGEKEGWTENIGANVAIISGLGKLISQNGIIGLLFFFISSLKSSSFFSEKFNYKGKAFLFVIILFISISYTIIFEPLIMCFWMYSFVEPRKIYTQRSFISSKTSTALICNTDTNKY